MFGFEKWFGGGEKNEVEKEEKKYEISTKEKARCLNIFLNNYSYGVDEEFVEAVIAQAGLTDEEVGDIVLAANNQGLNKEGLTFSAEAAYLNGLREKLARVLKQMDVAKLPPEK